MRSLVSWGVRHLFSPVITNTFPAKQSGFPSGISFVPCSGGSLFPPNQSGLGLWMIRFLPPAEMAAMNEGDEMGRTALFIGLL